LWLVISERNTVNLMNSVDYEYTEVYIYTSDAEKIFHVSN